MSVGVDVDGPVGVIELRDAPHNFLTAEMLGEVLEALEGFDEDPSIGATVVRAEGKAFCAGANLGGDRVTGAWAEVGSNVVYEQAARFFEVGIPTIAAIQGPAVGGGLGLAVACTFRVTCPEARFSANFVKIGTHHGFGLSVTLPHLVGSSNSAMVLLAGRRLTGDEALELGLADRCVPSDQLNDTALDLAREIATGAPLAIRAIHRTLRAGLADRIREATRHEELEQSRLFETEDFREGVRSYAERRRPRFVGR